MITTDKPNPIVSIVVASYNKEKYISETIKSVIVQSFLNWELIIVDDQSTDGTGLIVSSCASLDPRILLSVNSENKGANFCRNKGISLSKGKYIIFLDADDLLSPSCLSGRVDIMENTTYDFCVFTMRAFKKTPGDSNSLWKPDSKKALKDFLAHDLPWQTMQPIWSKNFLVRIGGFDEKFKRLQDVELHTRALFQPSVKYKLLAGEPDSFYRIDEERKNFNTPAFLERWIDSALNYCEKFRAPARELQIDHYLMGTIYRTYLALMYYYKTRAISKSDFIRLKSRLFHPAIHAHFNLRINACFKISSFFNLLPVRIPGVNFIINKILLL